MKIFHIQTAFLASWLLAWLAIAPAQPVQATGGFHPPEQGAIGMAPLAAPATRNDLILAMNTLRVSNGLPALIEDPIINAVAQATAETMAANNMSWHIGDVRGRLAAAGYGGGATVWATENFAVGNMGIDQIMQMWSDAEHMRPATIASYCHVGAGVAQAADGSYYYILQAAYTSTQSCGPYATVEGGAGIAPGVSQLIVPVKVATPDEQGRIYHIVQSGQSFWSIAIAYGVTINDLEIWNNLSREYDLYVGQKLFIPSSGTQGYATPPPPGFVVLATPDAQGQIVHKVQPYQALISIARAYNVSVEQILGLNGWQADWPLQVGQKLLIDPGKDTPTPLPPIYRLTPDVDGSYYHRVASGETLTGIAGLYDISLSQLMAWNGLNATSVIRPGQLLLLRVTPPPTFTPVPPTATATPTPAALTVTLAPSPSATPAGSETTEREAPTSASWIWLLVVGTAVTGVVLIGWGMRRR